MYELTIPPWSASLLVGYASLLNTVCIAGCHEDPALNVYVKLFWVPQQMELCSPDSITARVADLTANYVSCYGPQLLI